MGWGFAVFAILGGLVLLRKREPRNTPYLTLALAVYLTFTPIAEKEYRHAIYWLPALAIFALELTNLLPKWPRRVVFTGLVVTTIYAGTFQPLRYVWGYGTAAEYVVQRSSGERPILVDGELTGAFVYQIRHLDPNRRLQVLRGDKLFYSVQTDARTAYQEYAKDEQSILKQLHEYDPEWILIEDPQLRDPVPAGELLRKVLREHPQRFRLEERIPVQSNQDMFRRISISIYRKLDENPQRAPIRRIEVLGLGKAVLSGEK